MTLPKYCRILSLLLALIVMTGAGFASTLTGTAKNGTTGKPASGDDAILIELSQGMNEVGHTKIDSKGQFSFDITDGKPYLVRVMHQDVPYHAPVPPGSKTVNVTVYDAAAKVAGVQPAIQIIRLEA